MSIIALVKTQGSDTKLVAQMQPGTPADDPRYRNALYHLMASQTSC